MLKINPDIYKRIDIEDTIPNNIGFHLRMWKFEKDLDNPIDPIARSFSLQELNSKDFEITPSDCFLIFLVFREEFHIDPRCQNTAEYFPPSVLNVLPQFKRFKEESLVSPVISSMDLGKINRTMIDGGMGKNSGEEINTNLNYIGFVWEGLFCDDLMRAGAINKIFKLESYINKIGPKFLEIMFTGAIYNKGSIKAGTVLNLMSTKNQNYEKEELKAIKISRRKNLLLKM